MKMNRIAIVLISVLCMPFLMVSTGMATGNGYTPGSEGLMGPTLPPPGFHYKQYNIFVQSDELKDSSGDAIDNDFDLNVFAQAHRFIYFTEKKLFGADYGMTFILPVVATDFEIGAAGIHDSEIGIGDIFVEPLVLGWHGPRYDVALGFGAGLPTGSFDRAEPASCGNGYWYGMMTFGATYYLTPDKTWMVSALSRTLTYGEQDDTDKTPGDEFFIDWGIGKEIAVTPKLLVRPGVVGYGYWQLNDDSGPGTTDDHGRNFALGGEINFFWLPRLLQFNLRALQDFNAKDEAETTKIVFSVTASF